MIQETVLSLKQIAELAALANGIIPADDRDSGAAAVHAGPGIASNIRFHPYAEIYLEGLEDADRFSQEMFDRGTTELDLRQMDELMSRLRDDSPVFFRFLRSDVCAIYLSDPGVWQRIGFPGESSFTGGYRDFDQDPSKQDPSKKE